MPLLVLRWFTGGAFYRLHVARALVDQGLRVKLFDNLLTGYLREQHREDRRG